MKAPIQSLSFGAQWMEENGANISINCMLGTFHVTIGWCKLHSYSDSKGEHRETWQVSAHDTDLPGAIAKAFAKVLLVTKGAQ